MSNNKNKTPIPAGMQNATMFGSSPINVKHIPNHDFPSLKESQSIQKNNKNKPIKMNEKEFVNMSSLPYSADTHSTPHKTTQLNDTNNKNNQPNNNK